MAEPINRRTFLTAALAAAALCAERDPLHARTPALPFPKWVAGFRKRAQARGISDAVYDRVMDGIKPDTSVYALDRAQPEFTKRPGNISTGASPIGASRPERSAPATTRRFWSASRKNSASNATSCSPCGGWSSPSATWSPTRTYAPGHSRACRARLGRAAAPPRLGAGASQRARHHPARLGHAEGDDRLMGRRHGSYAVDARGLAEYGRRFQRQRQDLAFRPAR